MQPRPPRNPNLAPKSRSMQWYLCPACANLHVVLNDASGNPIATATVSEQMLQRMLEVVRGEATFGAQLGPHEREH